MIKEAPRDETPKVLASGTKEAKGGVIATVPFGTPQTEINLHTVKCP